MLLLFISARHLFCALSPHHLKETLKHVSGITCASKRSPKIHGFGRWPGRLQASLVKSSPLAMASNPIVIMASNLFAMVSNLVAIVVKSTSHQSPRSPPAVVQRRECGDSVTRLTSGDCQVWFVGFQFKKWVHTCSKLMFAFWKPCYPKNSHTVIPIPFGKHSGWCWIMWSTIEAWQAGFNQFGQSSQTSPFTNSALSGLQTSGDTRRRCDLGQSFRRQRRRSWAKLPS